MNDLVVFNDGGREDEPRTNDSNARSPTARLTEEASARKTRLRKYHAPPKRGTCLLPSYITACSFLDVTHRIRHWAKIRAMTVWAKSATVARPIEQSSLTIWWEEHREILIVFFYVLFFFFLHVYYTVIMPFSLFFSYYSIITH